MIKSLKHGFRDIAAALAGISIFIATSISPAFSQASYQIIDANNTKQTIKSFNCSAMICPGTTLMDATGAQFGTASNPISTPSTWRQNK